jgi:DNA-binding transcriptional LysR family regulator
MLSPLITELSLLHPGLQFDINLTDEYVDLVRTETDIGIRAGKLKDSSLKAKLLGTSDFQFVAAPSYIEKYGAPKKPIELQSHHCINALFGPASKNNQWVITNGTRTEKINYKPKWRVNNKAVALNLACAGLGITLVPSTLLSGYYERGELTHVLPGWGLEIAPVHLVYPPQKITSRKVREVSRFLEEKLKPMF